MSKTYQLNGCGHQESSRLWEWLHKTLSLQRLVVTKGEELKLSIEFWMDGDREFHTVGTPGVYTAVPYT